MNALSVTESVRRLAGECYVWYAPHAVQQRKRGRHNSVYKDGKLSGMREMQSALPYHDIGKISSLGFQIGYFVEFTSLQIM